MLLVDTQVVVWSQTDLRKVSKAALAAIQKARKRNELAVSAYTLYEIASLIERRRIRYHGSTESTILLLTEGFFIKPITAEIAALAVEFPLDFPRDPGDRIIAATARVADIPLVTSDERIQACDLVKTIW